MKRACTLLLFFVSLSTLSCGESESLVERALRIDAEANDEACICFFDALGYATDLECRAAAAARITDVQVTCLREAYDSHQVALAPAFECGTDAREEYLGCIRAAACDDSALTACEEMENATLDACPVADDADVDAYIVQFEACLGERLVGPPEGTCPGETAVVGVELQVDTSGRGDDSQSDECGGADAADVSVAFTADAAGTYRFSTAGSAFDTVLYALESCDGVELACNDEGERDSTSELELELAAGQSVVVVVDGFSAANAGAARLNITAL